MKRVLLLGDSISMGYREYVRELLAEEADVQYMEENGRFAKYTKMCIRDRPIPRLEKRHRIRPLCWRMFW